ncbi:guanylate kinase [bacterium]|nr:guanylate kinase [bacterium]
MSGHQACLVVAGPSGVGKSTLINAALKENPRWMFSVSATTRPRREGEVDARDYHFLDHAAFAKLINAGGFLEYAEVYGNLYGTPASEIGRAKSLDKHLLIEVDTVGCMGIRSLRPDIPMLAILPPSLEELRSRLRKRGTETEESLHRRFLSIMVELSRMRGFDFAIVNGEAERAVRQLLELMGIIEAGQMSVAELVDGLLAEANEVQNRGEK